MLGFVRLGLRECGCLKTMSIFQVLALGMIELLVNQLKSLMHVGRMIKGILLLIQVNMRNGRLA